MTATDDALIIRNLPAFAGMDVDARSRLADGSRIVRLPRGAKVLAPGRHPESYILLIAGSVRVVQGSEGGREIVLYRVAAGEGCALTTACLLGQDEYPAEAVAETEVEAVAVPRRIFDELIETSPPFRQLVFTTIARRITDLFRVIEDVAFARLDIRVAARLVALGDGAGAVRVTHQQLADEIGTAREVVSRQLAELQRRGLIGTSRGFIQIADRAGLEALARSR
jgi:CRP/FNR family transcriptional regulator